MNFSKLTEELISLFDKPLDLPIFTVNVPDGILVLMESLLKDKKFRLRKTYLSYTNDVDNHLITLVIRDDDEKDTYPTRFISDRVFVNGEDYAIIVIPEFYYSVTGKEQIINMINICTRACYLIQGKTGIKKSDFHGTDMVEFFAPMVVSLAVIGSKLSLCSEETIEIVHETLCNVYGIELDRSWIDKIIDDISEVGVNNLLDNSAICAESRIYLNAIAKYTIKNRKERETNHESV